MKSLPIGITGDATGELAIDDLGVKGYCSEKSVLGQFICLSSVIPSN